MADNKVPKEVVFADEATATSAVLGMYLELQNASSFGSGGTNSFPRLGGLSADELTYIPKFDLGWVEFEENNLRSNNGYILSLWNSLYKSIYQANSIIEGIGDDSPLPAAAKNQLTGEALFMRSFAYFYLVNLYGNAPLILTTDFKANAVAKRADSAEIYDQIVADLTAAHSLLPEAYAEMSGQKVRPNKYTASSLLSRVYLYLGDWENAETLASEVINHTALYLLCSNLNDVFLKNNSEAIWQLRPISTNDNGYTNEASLFAPINVYYYNVMWPEAVHDFEPGDLRFTAWHDTLFVDADTFYFPYKYKHYENAPMTEYSVVFRLAEQYLIRAEARTQLNNLAGPDGAESDLNMIRARAGLADIHPSSANEMMDAIIHERKNEFYAEWGHRWLDLKRLNKADEVLGPIKGSGWQSSDVLYPLPANEMSKNPNLRPQNIGY